MRKCVGVWGSVGGGAGKCVGVWGEVRKVVEKGAGKCTGFIRNFSDIFP